MNFGEAFADPLEKQIIALSATVKTQADKINDAKVALG